MTALAPTPPTPAELDALEDMLVAALKAAARSPDCVDEIDPALREVGITYRLTIWNSDGAYSEFNSEAVAATIHDKAIAPLLSRIAELEGELRLKRYDAATLGGGTVSRSLPLDGGDQ